MKKRCCSKALVTGGAGFIGSYIVDQLIEKGIETHVIDNLSTGSTNNLIPHIKSGLLYIHTGDIAEVSSVIDNEYIKGIDVVFHQAAIVSVPLSVVNPILVNEINVNSTLKLLEFCIRNSIKKFIFASSASVYGMSSYSPLTEDISPKPLSPYGASKLAIENYLHAYEKTYGLEYVILRYFNVFGPRQKFDSDYSGVITKFIQMLLQGQTPTIFGDGEQVRDFVHVADVANANILSMESNNAVGKTFNVGTGKATSIKNLFEILKELLKQHHVQPKYCPPRQGDIQRSVSSIEKAKEYLKYQPKVDFSEGLKNLIDHYRSQYNSY